MRKAALCALLTLTRGLAAFGGTSETWLGGTQPWDSVPFMELNLGLQGRGGDGRPALGPLAEWGIIDQLMLAGSWQQPLDGAGAGEALLKWREGSFPRWRPAVAAYVRGSFGNVTPEAIPALVLALEPWDQSLTANIERSSLGIGARLGYWSPYVVSFIRLGFEGILPSPNQAWRLVPQLTFQAPGDFSAVLGAQTSTDGLGQWAWMARVSYQLFPSP